ncbi:hypothetical protein EJ04DRAFT_526243 [Polyplosphaeria fusca]|uniref:Uncharacterized protein n=1 Tax=Polyplosphaeria fusca TaxID=682080 RepID=A0A9P4QPK9_9PLEO|nr:hypothetical protein EJ04DRAFT_526243 [Polyplosphaeria fusca]
MSRPQPGTVYIFGDAAPTKNLDFPAGKATNITAAEVLAFMPNWLKCRDLCFRLVAGGMTCRLASDCIAHFRAVPKTPAANSILKMMSGPMRDEGFTGWTVGSNEDWLPTNWDEERISVKGYQTPIRLHPERTRHASNAGVDQQQSIAFSRLADEVVNFPQGADALDLTACVLYAQAHPDEELMFPDNFADLVTRLGGPKPVTQANQDEPSFLRWAEHFASINGSAFTPKDLRSFKTAAKKRRTNRANLNLPNGKSLGPPPRAWPVRPLIIDTSFVADDAHWSTDASHVPQQNLQALVDLSNMEGTGPPPNEGPICPLAMVAGYDLVHFMMTGELNKLPQDTAPTTLTAPSGSAGSGSVASTAPILTAAPSGLSGVAANPGSAYLTGTAPSASIAPTTASASSRPKGPPAGSSRTLLADTNYIAELDDEVDEYLRPSDSPPRAAGLRGSSQTAASPFSTTPSVGRAAPGAMDHPVLPASRGSLLSATSAPRVSNAPEIRSAAPGSMAPGRMGPPAWPASRGPGSSSAPAPRVPTSSPASVTPGTSFSAYSSMGPYTSSASQARPVTLVSSSSSAAPGTTPTASSFEGPHTSSSSSAAPGTTPTASSFEGPNTSSSASPARPAISGYSSFSALAQNSTNKRKRSSDDESHEHRSQETKKMKSTERAFPAWWYQTD